MEAADYEVLSVREQLFHERVRECIVSAGRGGKGRTEVGRSTGVEREREKLGSECDHLISELCQTLPGPGLSVEEPRSDRRTCTPSWLTPRLDLLDDKQSELISVPPIYTPLPPPTVLSPPPAVFWTWVFGVYESLVSLPILVG